MTTDRNKAIVTAIYEALAEGDRRPMTAQQRDQEPLREPAA